MYYASAGLTLSHYDARAHLVVARRIIDSLTPGWQQIGAVWLPLPHLLNMLPVQVDACIAPARRRSPSRSISIAVAAWALSSWILRTTGSISGAVAAAAALARQPERAVPAEHADDRAAALRRRRRRDGAHGVWIDAGARRWPDERGLGACGRVPDALRSLADRGGDGRDRRRRADAPRRAGRCALRRLRPLAAWPAAAVAAVPDQQPVDRRRLVRQPVVSSSPRTPRRSVIRSWRWRRSVKGRTGCQAPRSCGRRTLGAALVVYAFVAIATRASVALLLALAGAAALPATRTCRATLSHPLRRPAGRRLRLADRRRDRPAVVGRLQPIAAAVVVSTALIQAPPLDRAAPLIVESARDAAEHGGTPARDGVPRRALGRHGRS